MKQHVLLRVLSAEADRDALRPILDALKEKGLRVSAAEGSLKKGEILLAALSGHFYADGEKQKTLLEVLSTGAENVLPLKLDETEIPETLMNALYARNIIMADGRDVGLIAERILAAVPEKKSALPKFLIAGAAVLAVLAGLLIWRNRAPQAEPKSAPEPTTEEETVPIPVPLGLTEEDLAKIIEVNIVGDQAEFYTEEDCAELGGIPEWDHFAVRSWEDDEPRYYSRKDGHEYAMTRYDDLRFLSLMPNLRFLYLSLVDAQELPELNQVEYVSLGDNLIADLSWLSAAPLKKIDVLDSRGAIRDYSPLTACEQLDQVQIDLIGSEEADLSGFSPSKLNGLQIINGQNLRSEPDLSALSSCTDLRECTLERIPITDLFFLSGAEKLESLIVDTCGELRDITGVGTLKNLKNLEILYCGRVTDYTPIAGCSALEHIRFQCDNNPNALRDASFLSDLPKLKDIHLYACSLYNMNFLEGIAQHQPSISLGFAGDIQDYSGLAFVKHYNYLHVNPRGGYFPAVLPYIQDAQIDSLMLYECSGVNLNGLPDGIWELSIRYGNLEDLSGLKPYSLQRMELWDCQYLRSLSGMENIPTLFGGKRQAELEVVGCPRLTDWSALDGACLENLKVVGTYSLPDLGGIQTNVLRLESIEGMSDLHCLDALDNSQRYNLEFVGLDDLYDLTPLRRLNGDMLTVPPQVAEQAEELVEDGNFRQYDVAYPDGSWRPYEGSVELLSLEELETLPKSLLKRVEKLRLAGDTVIREQPGWIENDWEDEQPVLYWYDPDTNERTEIEMGSITSLDILADLTGLRELDLICEPLSSLDGIQNLSSLENVQLQFCPNLTDGSAAFALQDLWALHFNRCPVESIQGVQNLSRLKVLNIMGSAVNDLSPLQDCDFTDAYEDGGLSIWLSDIPAEDFSPISGIRRLQSFDLNDRDSALWAPALENAEVYGFSGANVFRDNESFAAFAAAHPELEQLSIPGNEAVTDLSPVLSLERLQTLVVSVNMEAALEAVRAAGPGFEIEVRN